ncbi:MAG TPA: GNAT family N-acetyltransferase [Phycicoccus sp.]|jgi:ribosomal protein S18 acetylase RimI-like enzyme|nr:GNAT family N-acetyltransferase [Phycicoccus sp.]HQK30906.1 GNAT family N-acetyltransferase [Phycicoccus sp.]HQV92012.1 GNAT family N-acetyltransferase [Phycicoccus sp.]HQY98137.1 GNAT family N-acetyltransferase [Phycicoccus sp.]
MADIHVRALTDGDWELFRSVRLRALEESPEAFVADHASEADEPEGFWHDRLARSQRLLAEVDDAPVGIVSLGPVDDRPEAGQIFGLWVDPALRGSGVATALVRACVEAAGAAGKEHVLYWVGTDNGRAVAFASGFGFRPTSERRPMRVASEADGEEEIAMDLPIDQTVTGNAPRA